MSELKQWRLQSPRGGPLLGIHETENEGAELDALARDAGYRGYAHVRVVLLGPCDIQVTEVAERERQ